jgi:paraquat-inducible protein B
MTRTEKQSDRKTDGDDGFPKPIVKKMRWPFPLIWAVPILAAGLTVYFLRDKIQTRGPEITIQFDDGGGLKAGRTMVVIHGVQVGDVSDVGLTPDRKHVLVHVRLHRDMEDIGRKNTLFWIVKPEISIQAISGLGAILSGPYIEARPGDGEPTWNFMGSESPPVMVGQGIRIILHADRLEHAQIETPVTYRGIEVGKVQDIRLSDQGDGVNVTIFIREPYTPLVHLGSRFWTVSPADIKGGIFTGLQVKLDSLGSLLTGGIAFATPEKDIGPAAVDGAEFPLFDEPDKDWLKWKPKIPLPPLPAYKSDENETSSSTGGFKGVDKSR